MAESMLLIRGVVALFMVLLLIASSALLLKYFTRRNPTWLQIKVMGRVRLNRSAELVVVEYNGKRMLLGVTEGGISVVEAAHSGVLQEGEELR